MEQTTDLFLLNLQCKQTYQTKGRAFPYGWEWKLFISFKSCMFWRGSMARKKLLFDAIQIWSNYERVSIPWHCYLDMVRWLVSLNDPKAVIKVCNPYDLLQLSMLDTCRSFMLQVKSSVVDTIHSQRNTIVTGEENKATGDSKHNDNLVASGSSILVFSTMADRPIKEIPD